MTLCKLFKEKRCLERNIKENIKNLIEQRKCLKILENEIEERIDEVLGE